MSMVVRELVLHKGNRRRVLLSAVEKIKKLPKYKHLAKEMDDAVKKYVKQIPVEAFLTTYAYRWLKWHETNGAKESIDWYPDHAIQVAHKLFRLKGALRSFVNYLKHTSRRKALKSIPLSACCCSDPHLQNTKNLKNDVTPKPKKVRTSKAKKHHGRKKAKHKIKDARAGPTDATRVTNTATASTASMTEHTTLTRPSPQLAPVATTLTPAEAPSAVIPQWLPGQDVEVGAWSGSGFQVFYHATIEGGPVSVGRKEYFCIRFAQTNVEVLCPKTSIRAAALSPVSAPDSALLTPDFDRWIEGSRSDISVSPRSCSSISFSSSLIDFSVSSPSSAHMQPATDIPRVSSQLTPPYHECAPAAAASVQQIPTRDVTNAASTRQFDDEQTPALEVRLATKGWEDSKLRPVTTNYIDFVYVENKHVSRLQAAGSEINVLLPDGTVLCKGQLVHLPGSKTCIVKFLNSDIQHPSESTQIDTSRKRHGGTAVNADDKRPRYYY